MAKKKSTKKAAKKKVVKKSAKKIAPKKAQKKAAPKKVAKKATPKKASKKVAKKAVAKKPAAKKVTARKPIAKKASAKKPAAPKAVAAPVRTTAIHPYINFKGICEEAFNFYRSVFGGNFIYVGRYKDIPPSEEHPPISEADNEKIMHISLPIGNNSILMGCDAPDVPGMESIAGTNFSVSVAPVSKDEATRIFNGLAEDGYIVMPIGDTFWGAYFGMLKDKFGISWMVNFEYDKK